MFRGYLGQDERYRKCFAGDLYLTGDLARRDADGYFWFVGRADDVIKSAGHLIGPFEVESALLEHPAVAEAGVIGVPDPILGAAINEIEYGARETFLRYASKRSNAVAIFLQIDMHKNYSIEITFSRNPVVVRPAEQIHRHSLQPFV